MGITGLETRATIVALLLGLLVAGLAGCGRESAGNKFSGHVHRAPHGGTLVEVGKHQYNVELVFDGKRGVLQAYILDGHAENFVRVGVPEFELAAASAGGRRESLAFKAVGNPLTGEAPGSTSLFEAPAAWLAEAKAFDGTIKAINVRGTVFSDIPVKFTLPQTTEHGPAADSSRKKSW